MRFKVTGPDGKKHLMSADSEEALRHAIQEMHGGGEPPTVDVESLDVRLRDLLDVLERIASRPEPTAPEFPEFPKPEKVDFAPVIAAIKRLEGDWTNRPPDHSAALDAIAGQVAAQGEEIASLREDLLKALERICAAVTAPRELVRDSDGRPVRSIVDQG